uniref:Uncharacterized protein n=1 Tax=Avena sativa TaxID=4498 RepID=A0ACD5YJX3_AVESA
MWRNTREAEERKYFMRCIEKMEEEDLEDGTFTKELPRLKIVKHHDLLEKLWGWERLLPMGDSVKWPEYSTYLKEYHRRNVAAAAAGHKVAKEGPASRNGPGGDGDGITADGAANTTGGGISDVLNSQYKKKIESGDKSKMKKEDVLEKLWGWERLLPLSGSAKWADYLSYLEEYYQHNASEFVAGALADQNPEDSQIDNNGYIGAALAKSCLKMEEELLSEWKNRVDETLPISTIIQSGLIKELALTEICSTGGELFAPSDLAFVCMANEAELMVELQKHGVKIFDDMMEQSRAA